MLLLMHLNRRDPSGATYGKPDGGAGAMIHALTTEDTLIMTHIRQLDHAADI